MSKFIEQQLPYFNPSHLTGDCPVLFVSISSGGRKRALDKHHLPWVVKEFLVLPPFEVHTYQT